MKAYYYILLIISISATATAKQVTEFTKDHAPIVLSSSKTLGKQGQGLTQDITKILNKISRKNPELADNFGQLEAMYYISFDEENSSKPCILFSNNETQTLNLTPNIKLINSTDIDSSTIKGISIIAKGVKTYFLKSKDKLIRVRYSDKGLANISYYKILKSENDKFEHLRRTTLPLINKGSNYVNAKESFRGIYKNTIKANEVSIVDNVGKIGVYTDDDTTDTNIQVKISGVKESTKNYITHTHTKYLSSDYRTQLGLELGQKTGLKVTTGSRTGESTRIYSSDYDLEKTPTLTKAQLEEIELQRLNQKADQFYSAELFHDISSQDRVSILFEETKKRNHNKRQILGAKYSHDFLTKNLEVITIVQGQIKGFDNGPENSPKDDEVSGWIRVKYSW